MKIKKLSKKFILLLIVCILILSDILISGLLYLFEPVAYNAPDLSSSDYSFDLYSKYNDTDSDFYIKQVKSTDVKASDDLRLKYVDNTILLITDDELCYEDVKIIVSPFNGYICGYIGKINFYQIEFPVSDLTTLQNICSDLVDNKGILCAIVDYFEETPLSNESVSDYLNNYNSEYYLDLINYPSELSYYNIDPSCVTVGMLDVNVDSSSEYLNVINSDTYDVTSLLSDSLMSDFNNHGTHVAGIFCASENSNAPGICPGARLISENAMNNSISYWIAAIADMIINYNAKVINMSVGYNEFIPLSATLSCKDTLNYINNESEFFYNVFNNLLDEEYEFIVCVAAGNSSGSSVNRLYDSYFNYGDKSLLDKFDVFNIFTENVRECDTRYSLMINNIDEENVADRIIVVGACNESRQMSFYSNLGNRIDLVAPGDNIYSLSTDDSYEYMSGTSMAAPFVSGTAALLFAADDSLTGKEVKDIIISSSTEKIEFNNYYYPVLNVKNSLDNLR